MLHKILGLLLILPFLTILIAVASLSHNYVDCFLLALIFEFFCVGIYLLFE